MIWDCFLFHNEYDVLDVRLAELDPVVDRFVVLESSLTFSGKPKQFNIPANIERYAKYRDKMVVLMQVGDPNLDSWGREQSARNGLRLGLEVSVQGHPETGAQPDDTIILSDVDEIPSRATIEALAGTPAPQSLWLKKFSYGINVLTTEQHGSVKVFPYRYLKDKTLQEIRKTDIKPYVRDAGWEFSSLGTAEQVSQKLKSFSHTELDVDGISDAASIQARMDALEDVAGRGYEHERVEVDDTWPEAIKANREYWKRFEL